MHYLNKKDFSKQNLHKELKNDNNSITSTTHVLGQQIILKRKTNTKQFGMEK